ncbi:MAG: protein kinase [Candidatus Schekmanbacteria bacterium]|nr:protein kinase [Candidatus Schekmanbacteria bacterium]
MGCFGPYEVIEPLGRGGMGVVYRARHRSSGAQVALKTLRLHSESLLYCLRREITALSRLHHPGIVRIREHGVREGVPWYAMDLLAGATLRHFLDEKLAEEAETLGRTRESPVVGRDSALRPGAAGPVPEPAPPGSSAPPQRALELPELLSVTARVCDALAFLHGEGIVHRDLKPENICLERADSPILFDFGLSSLARAGGTREQLELSGDLVGSAPYVSPEQIRGEPPDARADLYSLGCILYELLTGRPPFRRPTASETFQAHLGEPVLAPSALTAGIPGSLDQLVLMLLQKDRRDRLGYAVDVAARLRRIGNVPAPRGTEPKARVYLYRPGFVGRQQQMERLLGELGRAAATGRGSWLVSGASGVGKTRFLAEMAHAARQGGMRVVTGECVPLSSSTSPGMKTVGRPLGAFQSFLEAVTDRCVVYGPKETCRLLGERGALLFPFCPAMAALARDEAEPTAVALPADLARGAICKVMCDLLAAMADELPLLLVLDDLQWADELSLVVLRHASGQGALASGRAMICGAFRAGGDAPALGELISTMADRITHLERLESRDIGAMIGAMLAMARPPADLIHHVHHHAEGNPLFVVEYLHAAVTAGILRRSDRGRWELQARDAGGRPAPEGLRDLPLPASLRDLIVRDLGGLSEEAASLLEGAAILGRSVSGPLLGQLVDSAEEVTLAALDELLRRGMLQEVRPSWFRFGHDKIREVVEASLSSARRRCLHERAARALEQRTDSAAEFSDAALASHWEEAGERARARPYYLSAARRAAGSYAYAEAKTLYEAYSSTAEGTDAETDAESIEARLELARTVLTPCGELDGAQREYEAALNAARTRHLQAIAATALHGLGGLALLRGRLSEARDYLEQALAIQQMVGDPASQGKTLSNLANLYRLEGVDLRQAQQLFERALELHRAAGDQRSEGLTLSNLAYLCANRGDTAKGRELLGRAICLHRETGDARALGLALGSLAVMSSTQGDLEAADALFDEALGLLRKVGDRRAEGDTLQNLAVVQHAQGHLGVALAIYREALELHRQVGNRRTEAHTLGAMAAASAAQGDSAAARRLFAAALELQRRVGEPRYEAHLLTDWAVMERRIAAGGASATPLLERAEEIFLAQGDRLGVGLCRCERGHHAIAAGDDGRAALDEVEKIAAALQLGPTSELAKAMRRLREAHEAVMRGERQSLQQGELATSMPAGIRRHAAEPNDEQK